MKILSANNFLLELQNIKFNENILSGSQILLRWRVETEERRDGTNLIGTLQSCIWAQKQTY
jgi:hypothetical protein